MLLFAVGICTAQLNFSTGWGKRASNSANASPLSDGNNCKTPIESLMMVYKLIQVK